MAILDRLHAAQAAFYSGEDSTAVRDMLTEDIEWHVPGSNAIAGDYYGIDEVLDYFTRRRDLARGTFRMHPRDVLSGSGDFLWEYGSRSRRCLKYDYAKKQESDLRHCVGLHQLSLRTRRFC